MGIEESLDSGMMMLKPKRKEPGFGREREKKGPPQIRISITEMISAAKVPRVSNADLHRKVH